MKYSTVYIRPASRSRDKWKTTFKEVDHDRVEFYGRPSPTGFYHYPKRMPKQDAFEALRNCMVEKHETAIAKLTKSLKKLNALKLPTDQ